jgi:hypothetical protein
VLFRGRIGESFGYTETGCIVEKRVGYTEAGCCIEEPRRRCVGRRGLDALLHIYIIFISVYLLLYLNICHRAGRRVVAEIEGGGLTRTAAVT